MRQRLFVGKDRHKFSSAHMTVFPDGTKERLHGHNYQVRATLELRDVSLANLVPVADVKAALDAQCAAWDERLLLAERCPFLAVVRRDAAELEVTLCGRRYVLPADEVVFLPVDNVTVEQLAGELARALLERLRPALRRDVVAGLEVEVTETPGQGAASHIEV